MKVVEMSAVIVSGRSSAAIDIKAAARTCYKSDAKGNPAEFVKRLRRNGHMAMLEFADFTFHLRVPRGVSHELVRHRMCSFAQESTRYVNYGGKDIEFIAPYWAEDEGMDEPYGLWLEHMRRCESAYHKLIDSGLKPQDARGVLPLDLATTLVMKANAREWLHIIELRCSPKAHPQMQQVMGMVRELLVKGWPAIFGELT